MGFEPTPEIDYSGYAALKIARTDGILEVTLCNPGRRNAVTPAMSLELARVWDDIWADPDTAVIILSGEGDSFCSGADLAILADAATESDDERTEWLNTTTRMVRKHVMGILDCEKPVIAKVRGPAFGLGATLALACDMVFASPEARICDSHVKAGLAAGDGGVLLWPLAVGFHRAKEYLMTGTPVPAAEAERIGLINRVVPTADLDREVLDFARKLRDLPPHAVAYTKASLNVALKQMMMGGFETSLAYELYAMRTADHREALAAFGEKRKGRFRGR